MNPDDFQIKYWAGTNDFSSQNRKTTGRSVAKKLFIVFSFVGILALIPTALYALSDFNANQTKQVSVAAPTSQTIQTPPTAPTPQISPKTQTETVEVLNNDSYWKISKRICGTGKYYLSIQTQNNSKSLHKGDFVTVDCTLE